MLIKLTGGTVYDPANGIDGEVRDLWIRDRRIIAEPGPAARPDAEYDVRGQIVMAGAIDGHSHIAGGNVNQSRLLLPEQHVAELGCCPELPFQGARWSTFETGYRYAQMGFTTVVEPAMLPVNALHAHLEFGDIPIIDKAALAVLGSDDFLLRLLHQQRPQREIDAYVGWTLEATRALGIKLINPGGTHAFKFNVHKLDLDDEVPVYGVSSRRILQALSQAVHRLGVPHPLHVHCNNLGLAGNVSTALATIEAAEGLPLHLAHVQFYSYDNEGKRGFSSGAARLAEALKANPNVSIDVGQVLFGQTVTVSCDTMRQQAARSLARPHKWISWDIERGGGGGILPYDYRAKSFVNALQWAIGLELFLLADDPWRVLLTTDHPNGAPFTCYPQLFRLLMDADYRAERLTEVNASASQLSQLPQIRREYSLYDVAIVSRAAPARLLGLTDRGQLGVGAAADVAVYRRQDNWERTFGAAALVFKDGRLVVRDGAVLAEAAGLRGAIHTARVDYDRAIENEVRDYLDQYHTLSLNSLKLTDDILAERLIAHPGG